MNDTKNVVGKIMAGSSPVYEVIEDKKRGDIIIRVVDEPEKFISIPRNAIHILIDILIRLFIEGGFQDDDIIMAMDLIKTAAYRNENFEDRESKKTLNRLLKFFRIMREIS